jgi:hypothetical protein
VCNYIRQKAGEIEAFKTLEVGTLKWCKEHVPRDGNDWTEEGQMLLDAPELWLDHLTFSDGRAQANYNTNDNFYVRTSVRDRRD